MSAALFGHALTLNFALGVGIVAVSMHFFFSLGASLALALITQALTCWPARCGAPAPCMLCHAWWHTLRPSRPPAQAGSPSKGGGGTPGKGKDGGRGVQRAPSQLAVSPSMDHLASLSSLPSSASVASLASVAEAEGAPLLGPAARMPILPR